jgi:hypothetical protein
MNAVEMHGTDCVPAGRLRSAVRILTYVARTFEDLFG